MLLASKVLKRRGTTVPSRAWWEYISQETQREGPLTQTGFMRTWSQTWNCKIPTAQPNLETRVLNGKTTKNVLFLLASLFAQATKRLKTIQGAGMWHFPEKGCLNQHQKMCLIQEAPKMYWFPSTAVKQMASYFRTETSALNSLPALPTVPRPSLQTCLPTIPSSIQDTSHYRYIWPKLWCAKPADTLSDFWKWELKCWACSTPPKACRAGSVQTFPRLR